MGSYHDFCISQIKSALKYKKHFDDISFKYALKSGLIGLYAETYYLGKIEFKFFDINFGTNKNLKGHNVWKVLLGSKEAYDLCIQIENKEMEYCKKEHNAPFYEHIEPKSITYGNIMNLNKNATDVDIKEVLDKSKLVMLTFDQKKYLDQKEESFNELDEIYVKDHFSQFLSNQELSLTIESMKEDGKFLRCNQYGNSFARMAHLLQKGIKFMLGDVDATDEMIIDYLKSDNHSI